MGHDVCEAMGASATCVALGAPLALIIRASSVCRLRQWSHQFSFGKLPAQCDAHNEAF